MRYDEDGPGRSGREAAVLRERGVMRCELCGARLKGEEKASAFRACGRCRREGELADYSLEEEGR